VQNVEGRFGSSTEPRKEATSEFTIQVLTVVLGKTAAYASVSSSNRYAVFHGSPTWDGTGDGSQLVG